MVKSTGIVRDVDNLGRIVLPIELRRAMDIEIGTAMEVYEDEKSIILKKYEPGCVFCGHMEPLVYYKGKKVCRTCISQLLT